MRTRIFSSVLIVLVLFSLPVYAQLDDMYAGRRQQVMKSMDGGIAVLFSKTQATRWNRTLNRNFYYLTGIKDQDVTLILIPGGNVKEILFNKSGKWKYAESLTSAEVYKSDELAQRLNAHLRGKDKVYASFSDFETLPNFGSALAAVPTIKNINPIIVNMRVIKDSREIELLKKACKLTAEGLNDVYRAVEPGLREKDLALIIEYGFERRESIGKSFLQTASGPNSVNIHFGTTERKLQNGDMIVFDTGAYWNEYTSDISRTIPVSGHFTKEQREIYQLVLDAQNAAIELMVPGSKMDHVEKAAQDVLINGLYKLGLVLDKDSQWQRRFFIQHGFYHFIGLDVHDVWYEYDKKDKIYEPGMVMTMEPGLYFPEKHAGFNSKKAQKHGE